MSGLIQFIVVFLFILVCSRVAIAWVFRTAMDILELLYQLDQISIEDELSEEIEDILDDESDDLD